MNSAGTPELRILTSPEQLRQLRVEQPPAPVSDDEVDKKLAQQMNQLQIADEEKVWRQVELAAKPSPCNPDEPVCVPYSSLGGADLAIRTQVNVRTINNPTYFIVIAS